MKSETQVNNLWIKIKDFASQAITLLKSEEKKEVTVKSETQVSNLWIKIKDFASQAITLLKSEEKKEVIFLSL